MQTLALVHVCVYTLYALFPHNLLSVCTYTKVYIKLVIILEKVFQVFISSVKCVCVWCRRGCNADFVTVVIILERLLI